MQREYKRAYYWTVTNNDLNITIQVCKLSLFLREMKMEKDYSRIYAKMYYSEDGKAVHGKYTFRRVLENPYPKLIMMLNGEIKIEKKSLVFNDKKGLVESKDQSVVVPKRVNPTYRKPLAAPQQRIPRDRGVIT